MEFKTKEELFEFIKNLDKTVNNHAEQLATMNIKKGEESETKEEKTNEDEKNDELTDDETINELDEFFHGE